MSIFLLLGLWGGLQAPDSLTVQEAVRRALENNPMVAAAVADRRAASSRLDMARAERLPDLRLTGLASRYSTSQRMLPPGAPGQPLVYTEQMGGADLALELPLFQGGRLRHEVGAAEAAEAAWDHRLTWTREELAYRVAATFFAVLRQEQITRSVAFSVEAMEAHERNARELLAAGKAARVDVLRTQVRLADLRQRLLAEGNEFEVQKKLLAYLVGEEDGAPLPPLKGTLQPIPFEGGVEDGVTTALARRPDVLAARATLESQQHRVDGARGARWPALSLRGTLTERWAISPLERPAGADASPVLGFFGLVVALPLFDGGAASARVGEARALLSGAEARTRDLERLVRLQVEEAFMDATSARARVGVTETSVQQAEETLEIEREKYRLGKGSVTDVLDAQAELLAAETARIGALAEYNTAVARCSLVTGERASWEPHR